MGFLTEMLAVAVVWLSSFALCQFGVAVDHGACPHAKNVGAKTVARSRRDLAAKPAPIAVNATTSAPRDA
jgi:hypothetical protein